MSTCSLKGEVQLAGFALVAAGAIKDFEVEGPHLQNALLRVADHPAGDSSSASICYAASQSTASWNPAATDGISSVLQSCVDSERVIAADVCLLGVVQEHQRQGLGQQMMRHIFDSSLHLIGQQLDPHSWCDAIRMYAYPENCN